MKDVNEMKVIFLAVVASAMIIQGFSLPFFSGKCTLKNKYYDEYLYASIVENDGSRRRVYTWIEDATWIPDEDCYFHIDAEYGGTYSIKNKKHDEYLYPFYDNTNKRPVYTWIPLPRSKFAEGSWKIEPVDNAFTIKNVVYNEFLYAAAEKYSSDRREIYTSGSTDTSSHWIITCDSSEGK